MSNSQHNNVTKTFGQVVENLTQIANKEGLHYTKKWDSILFKYDNYYSRFWSEANRDNIRRRKRLYLGMPYTQCGNQIHPVIHVMLQVPKSPVLT